MNPPPPRILNPAIGICCIIYYLAYAQYLTKIVRPVEILTKLFGFTDMDSVIDEHKDDKEWSDCSWNKNVRPSELQQNVRSDKA